MMQLFFALTSETATTCALAIKGLTPPQPPARVYTFNAQIIKHMLATDAVPPLILQPPYSLHVFILIPLLHHPHL